VLDGEGGELALGFEVVGGLLAEMGSKRAESIATMVATVSAARRACAASGVSDVSGVSISSLPMSLSMMPPSAKLSFAGYCES
jgi:hypothetical protein